MKVLHISEKYAPTGGVGTYLLGVLDELERRGHENVVIYQHEHPRTVRDKSRAAYHIPRDGDGEDAVPGAFRTRLREIIEGEDPDVVYFHLVYDPAVVELSASCKPTVAYVHALYLCCPGLVKYFRRTSTICTRPFSPVGCVLNIYLRRCASARHPRSVYRVIQTTAMQQRAYRQVDRVLVASTYMKDLLVQNNFDPQRIEVLPYFINFSVEPGEASRGKENPPVVLYAGRLEREKGVPYLLKAMSLVKTPCQLIIAGDGTCMDEYKVLAHRLGVAGRTIFTGWLSDSTLKQLYEKALVLVMPSICPEPFGLSGLEAMTFGTPVIAFSVGGIPDWLEDGKNGFLVEPKNAMQLAGKIDLLLQDRELARKMGEYGRQQVAQKYSVDHHLRRLMEVLQEVI